MIILNGDKVYMMDSLSENLAVKQYTERIKKELTALPFEDKIRRLIEIQKISKDLKKDRNIEVFVWEMM